MYKFHHSRTIDDFYEENQDELFMKFLSENMNNIDDYPDNIPDNLMDDHITNEYEIALNYYNKIKTRPSLFKIVHNKMVEAVQKASPAILHPVMSINSYTYMQRIGVK